MKAKDVMTTAVITAKRDGTVEDAVRLMLKHHVSALPVVDDDSNLVGVISEGDLMRRLKDKDLPRRSWWLELFADSDDSPENFVKARSHRITDVMTRDVMAVSEQTPVGEIARTLESRRIKRVPVVQDAKVVGIVSRSNLLQALAQAKDGKLASPSPSDDALRHEIAQALAEVPGATVSALNFTVHDGKVSLWGVVDSDFVENALRVAAENVPGVRDVDVQLGRMPSWGYGI